MSFEAIGLQDRRLSILKVRTMNRRDYFGIEVYVLEACESSRLLFHAGERDPSMKDNIHKGHVFDLVEQTNGIGLLQIL